MSTWIGDHAVAHLREVADWPDAGARYEILGRLGRGGMGAVYEARDRTLDRVVALKVLDDLPATAAVAVLQDEARVLARLEHPGIVPVHDAGRLADGRIFYVMKRVRGARLDEALDARASLPERLALFLRICDAVAFAHAHGIVHRDLKPENVMLGEFGEVLVMDWGVAMMLDRPAATDLVVGTPGFMPPEQARSGERPIDGRADVYALGAILDAMLPRPLPRPLAAIAQRARAEAADDRYPTVAALARDVERFRDGGPVSAYAESPVERLARIYRRHRLPILLVLAYVIMRAALLWWNGI